MNPGDVTPEGMIYRGSRIGARGERVDEVMKNGTVMVTLAQAEAAAAHGWEQRGEPHGDLVLIERRAEDDDT